MYIHTVWLRALHGIAGCEARLDTPAWALWVCLLEPRAEQPAASRRPSRRVQAHRWRRILPVCPPAVSVLCTHTQALSRSDSSVIFPRRASMARSPPHHAPCALGCGLQAPGSEHRSRCARAQCRSPEMGIVTRGRGSNRRPGQAREHIMMCPVDRSISQPDEPSDPGGGGSSSPVASRTVLVLVRWTTRQWLGNCPCIRQGAGSLAGQNSKQRAS